MNSIMIPEALTAQTYTSITGCRSCGSPDLQLVLDLGKMPLANSLPTEDQLLQPELLIPLTLTFCRQCALTQIKETVEPEILFGNYLYVSSYSDTLLEHAGQIAYAMQKEQKLGPNSLVIEIASNDGYLLKHYVAAGIPVLGIEPARNIADIAQRNGVETICEFFEVELASKLAKTGIRANVIHANNVLAHVADLNGVVSGIAQLLKDDGVAVIEVPYVKDMIDRNEFDTVYHEHLCYFSLTALNQLFDRHDMTIVDFESLPIHGGSLRIFAVPGKRNASSLVEERLQEEYVLGINAIGYFIGFARSVESLKQQLVSMLHALKASGKSIGAYGASAKGSTLLNYFGLGNGQIDFVVDRSSLKQGRFTPGTHLPILHPDRLVELRPDYTLLLTWNFEKEILEQQKKYRQLGGKFIVPIPSPKIV